MAVSIRKTLTNAGVLVASSALLLGTIELTLRLTGFSFVLHPEAFEFGKPDPELLRTGFLPDDDLLWVPQGYFGTLARLAEGDLDLLFLGDSCTQLGSYDREVARLIADRRGRPVRYGNLAVAGWSSYQGRRQLERDVVPLAPRLVTLYFGWNDHWVGFGIEDKTVARIRRLFATRWSRLRLVQLATKATVATVAGRSSRPNRVSLEDFRANLRSMVRTARRHRIEPVLLTAPTSHRRGAEPAYLARRWLRDLAELVPLHEAYADAVRRVAGEEDAVLCDLHGVLSERPAKELARWFRDDGIHLTPEGDLELARELVACLASSGALEGLAGPGLAAHPPSAAQ